MESGGDVSSNELNDDDTVGDTSDDADSYGSDCEDDAIDEDGQDEKDDDVDEGTLSIGEEGSEDECSDSDELEEEESCSTDEADDSDEDNNKIENRKRKFDDFDLQLHAAKGSLPALKKLTTLKLETTTEADDLMFSNEDFKRMKELQAKKKVTAALSQHGLLKGANSNSASIKIPSPGQLNLKPLDPAKFESSKGKLTKEQRVAMMKAGRADRDPYTSKTATKKRKIAGSSNSEKNHKKKMPHRAMLSKITRNKEMRKMKKKGAGKQFRAWKK